MLPIAFFTDQCVLDSVGACVIECGHALTRLREVMLVNSDDAVVAAACVTSGQVLITNDGDFKAVARRLNVTQRTYREQFHKVRLRCDEPIAAQRLGEAMSIIEHEWANVLVGRDQPLSMEITNVAIRIER